MLGATELYTALNVSTITNLLDSWGSDKALFNDSLLPESFTGKESINFYLVTPHNGGNEIEQYEYSINCRAETYKKSTEMAFTVFTELNRSFADNAFKICSILRTIPPADDTDVYNTPVQIKIKMR